jgi:diaminopimelate decarboxylase
MRNPLAPARLDFSAEANELTQKLWPRDAVRNSDGELVIAGVPVSELASQFGTPLYVISEDEFRARLRDIDKEFSRESAAIGVSCKLYYAAKSLLTVDIARWIAEAGWHLDVATGGELAVALAANFPVERIGLHGNNKSLHEISRAVSCEVGSIVIDSEIEIERIAAVASALRRVQPVRLRVNVGVHAHTHEYLATASEDQKFGVALDEVASLVATIRGHASLRFLGLHTHIGSQIFIPDAFLEAADRLLRLHAQLCAEGPVPELNLGGGFGVAYLGTDQPLPISEFAQRIIRAIEQKSSELGIAVPNLAFEPGRSVSAVAGITLYNLGTVKNVAVSESATGEPIAGQAKRKYLSVDGGMSDNIRPALYGSDYSVVLASRTSAAEPALSRVVGKHCESGDVLVWDALLPGDVAPNDLLAVPVTGSYCFSLGSNYNYLPKPALVSVKSGKAELLVRAETESDLLQRDLGTERKET